MKKVIRYFKDNGLNETVRRIANRSLSTLGLRKSNSYIFSYKSNDGINSEKKNSFNYVLAEIRRDQLKIFESVNYYDFIDADKLLKSGHSRIYIAMDGNEIVGYIWCHFNVEHTIHKMGKWQLGENEAWIGPTYVVKKYRNKSIHKHLLLYCISMMENNGIKSFYTAINENNMPSVKSFAYVGFEKIGMITIKNILNISKNTYIIDDVNNIVSSKFKK